jgi:two-component system nitrogen regulation sensor histidine kinase GlnL
VARDLQSILDAHLDGVILVDAGGVVESVNPEACRVLELSAELLRKRPVEEILGADHAVALLARAALRSGRALVEDDVVVERRYEDALRVDVAASPIRDEGGGEDGALVVLRDRSVGDSLRELDSEREELAGYGRIAAGIAHEVKNPLSGIRGAAELLEARSADDRQRAAARIIVREVDRISGLVDELMVFARGEDLKLEPLNVHRVLDGVIELLGVDPLSARCEIERIYDPSIPEFLGDADRLTQVFLNLARNGLQSMEDRGGTLSVVTRMALDQRLAGEGGRRHPTVLVAFSDTGPGIAPEILRQLTTPFFTTRPRGTGLGLAVARHWVLRHGGALRITSQPGEGTTAYVALPLRRPSP